MGGDLNVAFGWDLNVRNLNVVVPSGITQMVNSSLSAEWSINQDMV